MRDRVDAPCVGDFVRAGAPGEKLPPKAHLHPAPLVYDGPHSSVNARPVTLSICEY
ncbi:hypothetical protein [Hydrogenimonas sp.]